MLVPDVLARRVSAAQDVLARRVSAAPDVLARRASAAPDVLARRASAAPDVLARRASAAPDVLVRRARAAPDVLVRHAHALCGRARGRARALRGRARGLRGGGRGRRRSSWGLRAAGWGRRSPAPLPAADTAARSTSSRQQRRHSTGTGARLPSLVIPAAPPTCPALASADGATRAQRDGPPSLPGNGEPAAAKAFPAAPPTPHSPTCSRQPRTSLYR